MTHVPHHMNLTKLSNSRIFPASKFLFSYVCAVWYIITKLCFQATYYYSSLLYPPIPYLLHSYIDFRCSFHFNSIVPIILSLLVSRVHGQHEQHYIYKYLQQLYCYYYETRIYHKMRQLQIKLLLPPLLSLAYVSGYLIWLLCVRIPDRNKHQDKTLLNV